MKKRIYGLGFLMFLGVIGVLKAASSNTTGHREYESYADTGDCMWHENGTTSGTAGLISTVTVPTCAKGFRITPVTTAVSYSVSSIAGSNVVESPTSSSAGVAITTTTLNIGNRAKNDASDVRLLPANEATPRQRYIYVMSSGTSVVFYIEFF